MNINSIDKDLISLPMPIIPQHIEESTITSTALTALTVDPVRVAHVTIPIPYTDAKRHGLIHMTHVMMRELLNVNSSGILWNCEIVNDLFLLFFVNRSSIATLDLLPPLKRTAIIELALSKKNGQIYKCVIDRYFNPITIFGSFEKFTKHIYENITSGREANFLRALDHCKVTWVHKAHIADKVLKMSQLEQLSESKIDNYMKILNKCLHHLHSPKETLTSLIQIATKKIIHSSQIDFLEQLLFHRAFCQLEEFSTEKLRDLYIDKIKKEAKHSPLKLFGSVEAFLAALKQGGSKSFNQHMLINHPHLTYIDRMWIACKAILFHHKNASSRYSSWHANCILDECLKNGMEEVDAKYLLFQASTCILPFREEYSEASEIQNWQREQQISVLKHILDYPEVEKITGYVSNATKESFLFDFKYPRPDLPDNFNQFSVDEHYLEEVESELDAQYKYDKEGEVVLDKAFLKMQMR